MPRLPRLTALKAGLSSPAAPAMRRVEIAVGRLDLDHVRAHVG